MKLKTGMLEQGYLWALGASNIIFAWTYTFSVLINLKTAAAPAGGGRRKAFAHYAW
ncbi:MAG TPA: hypothetical protein VL003_05330 [Pusillimonas sp.]|nr:hypothetical protein [Pusillimonas sp.]